MNDTKKREMIKHYFSSEKDYTPLYIMGTGILAAIFINWLFILLIGIGFLLLKYKKRDKATDIQYDNWLSEDLKVLQDEAQKKTRIDPSELVRDSVTMIGNRWEETGGAKIYRKRGDDNKIRHTPLDITIIQFTEHQLVTYQTCYDFTTGNALNTGTKRFFYDDVVSAETQANNLSIDANKISEDLKKNFPQITEHITNDVLQLHQAETFRLTTRGGTSIQVVLNEPDYLGKIGTSDFTDRLTDQAINAINKMLITKKQR